MEAKETKDTSPKPLIGGSSLPFSGRNLQHSHSHRSKDNPELQINKIRMEKSPILKSKRGSQDSVITLNLKGSGTGAVTLMNSHSNSPFKSGKNSPQKDVNDFKD